MSETKEDVPGGGGGSGLQAPSKEVLVAEQRLTEAFARLPLVVGHLQRRVMSSCPILRVSHTSLATRFSGEIVAVPLDPASPIYVVGGKLGTIDDLVQARVVDILATLRPRTPKAPLIIIATIIRVVEANPMWADVSLAPGWFLAETSTSQEEPSPSAAASVRGVARVRNALRGGEGHSVIVDLLKPPTCVGKWGNPATFELPKAAIEALTASISELGMACTAEQAEASLRLKVTDAVLPWHQIAGARHVVTLGTRVVLMFERDPKGEVVVGLRWTIDRVEANPQEHCVLGWDR